jgi:hypothetical protein
MDHQRDWPDMSAIQQMLMAFGGGGPSWTPAEIFDGSTLGVWLDPSDLSTVFQDSAATVPGAVGSPVGRIVDKSGNGVDAYQPTTGARPTLESSGGKYWIDCNGSSAWMFLGATAAETDFTTVVVSARATTRSVNRTFLGKPHDTTHTNPFFRWVLYDGSSTLAVRVNGTESILPGTPWPGTTPTSLLFNVPDGAFSAGGTSSTFTPATLTYPSAVQARLFANVAGGELFDGTMASLVIAARDLTSDELTNLAAWTAAAL